MSDLDRLISAIRGSEMLRLCLVGALTLVLLIPVAMIAELVSERQDRYREAVDEVSSKWGRVQDLTGPALVLPYEVTESTVDGGETAVRTVIRHAVFLPRELEAVGEIQTETLRRGIFAVPVYSLSASVDGVFDYPDLDLLGIDPGSVLWNRAHFVQGISDVHALRGQSMLSWNDGEAEFFPGTGGFGQGAGVQAPVPLDPPREGFANGDLAFSFSLSLDGSEALFLGPFAEETHVRLTSSSGDPSFQGQLLPTERSVSADGFEAVWDVSYLGRNYPQAWVSNPAGPEVAGAGAPDAGLEEAIDASRFGVELVTGVDQYRMSDRSVKYAALFILLTFATVWLREVVAATRVHPIQYLMLGAALCVFYLLELSLAEHLGFHAAYAIAALSITGMVASYGRVMFRSWGRGVLVAGSVAGLYAYLFVLLTNEDAALLVGSIGLFVVLAVIMFVTRRIDWYGGVESRKVAAESGE